MATEAAFDIVYTSTDSGVSPVSTGGTLTFQYPANRSVASYLGGGPTLLNVRGLQGNYIQDYNFTVVLNPTNIVVTWLGATPIPVGAPVGLQIPVVDTSDQFDRQTTVMTPAGADSQYVFQANTPDRSFPQNVVPVTPIAGL